MSSEAELSLDEIDLIYPGALDAYLAWFNQKAWKPGTPKKHFFKRKVLNPDDFWVNDQGNLQSRYNEWDAVARQWKRCFWPINDFVNWHH